MVHYLKNICIALVVIAACWSVIPQTGTHPSVPRLSGLQFINLPQPIKDMLISGEYPIKFVLLKSTDTTSEVFYPFHSNDSYKKYAKHMQNFKRAFDHHKIYEHIPNGYYLVNLRDRIDRTYSAPFLAYSGHTSVVEHKNVVLIPDKRALREYTVLFSRIDKSIKKYTWSKKESTVFWRGAMSDRGLMSNGTIDAPRVNLVSIATSLPFTNIAFTRIRDNVKNSLPHDIMCQLKFADSVKEYDSLKYKYLLSIDGNTCTFARMAWILYSNSVLMKHDSEEVQWYYSYLQPYENYIPIKEDFSNLEQQYKWAENNPLLATEIANNGRVLAQEVFSENGIRDALIESFNRYHEMLSS